MTLALLLRFWWAPVIAAALALAGVQTLRLKASDASLHASHLETARETARARAWEASYRQADALRREEQGRALRAVSEAGAQCDARVSAARRSASAIQTIIQKVPTYDKAGCPTRERVNADSLRDALKPAGSPADD
jgi:hypothetical protein